MTQLTLEGNPSKQDRASDDFFAQLENQLKSCEKCSLAGSNTKLTHVGFGNRVTPVVVVVDGTGSRSVRDSGHPFSGCGGNLLQTALKDNGISSFYYTNTMKCEYGTVPSLTDLTACRYFLFRELNYLRPKIIVAIGTFALRSILGGVPDQPFGSEFSFRGIPVFCVPSPNHAISRPVDTFKIWNQPWKAVGAKYRCLT